MKKLKITFTTPTPPPHKFLKLLIVFFLIELNFNETQAQQNLGTVCTGQSKQMTYNWPSTHYYLEVTYFGEGPGGSNLIEKKYKLANSGSTASWSHTFNGIPGQVNILYTAYINDVFLISPIYTNYYINETLPAPQQPNNGILEFCGGYQTVQVSTNPALQNNAQDCYFHCNYIWEANGFNINGSNNYYEALTNSVSISGGGSGNLGQLKVTAKYSACLPNVNPQYDPANYTTLWGGVPNMSSYTVNGLQYTGNFVYVNNFGALAVQSTGSAGARNFSWSVLSGNCTLNPNGSVCNAFPNGFAIVKVQSSNNCGTGNSYLFYITSQGSSGFRIASNPTEGKKINILFDSEDLLNLFVTDISIFDKNGKTKTSKNKNEIKSLKNSSAVEIDLKGIEAGNYYLHVTMGEYIIKKEIIIN